MSRSGPGGTRRVMERWWQGTRWSPPGENKRPPPSCGRGGRLVVPPQFAGAGRVGGRSCLPGPGNGGEAARSWADAVGSGPIGLAGDAVQRRTREGLRRRGPGRACTGRDSLGRGAGGYSSPSTCWGECSGWRGGVSGGRRLTEAGEAIVRAWWGGPYTGKRSMEWAPRCRLGPPYWSMVW